MFRVAGFRVQGFRVLGFRFLGFTMIYCYEVNSKFHGSGLISTEALRLSGLQGVLGIRESCPKMPKP